MGVLMGHSKDVEWSDTDRCPMVRSYMSRRGC